jgi:tripartite-type tricarboxylate transporter receptor subunit TctC
MEELGFPGFDATAWFGLMAPAGTPAPIIDKLHKETVRLLALPDVKGKLESLGVQLVGSTPAEFAALIRTETPHWAKVIKDAGIKLND